MSTTLYWHDSDFTIPTDKEEEACKALRDWHADYGEDLDDAVEHNLAELSSMARWPMLPTTSGTRYYLHDAPDYYDENWNELWRALAPFVDDGSWIEAEVEGVRFRWIFENGRVDEVDALTVWPEGPATSFIQAEKRIEDELDRIGVHLRQMLEFKHLKPASLVLVALDDRGNPLTEFTKDLTVPTHVETGTP